MYLKSFNFTRITIQITLKNIRVIDWQIFNYLILLTLQYAINNKILNRLRLGILESLIDRYLIPSLEQETRRELIRVGREAIIEVCESVFLGRGGVHACESI